MDALRTLGCVLLLLVLAAPARGQATVTVQSGSEFWIEGRSSVNTFSCQVDTVHGRGQLTDVPSSTPTDAEPQATVQVPVRTFDCGKRRMTEDLYETLQAESHPTIRYELQSAEIVGADSASWHRIRARGTLTIAGTTRDVELTAYGQPLGEDRFRLCGSRNLQMSDFGIDPPTKLLGLIRVQDEIEVHFDLIAATLASSADAASPPQHSPVESPNNQCKTTP